MEVAPIMRTLQPDVIFRQSQWDNDYPWAFRTEMLASTRLCLVPYEMFSLVEPLGAAESFNMSLDSRFHRACWRVYCANDLVLSEAKKTTLCGRNWQVTGHPKFEYLTQAKPWWPSNLNSEKRVVWSAHHSIGHGWNDFGMFPKMIDEMIAVARDSVDIDFVFMPHPGLMGALGNGISDMSFEQAKHKLDEWNSLPNTAIYEGSEYGGLLKSAGVVITDGLSMLSEPQVVGTPVVFTEREGHIPFNKIGETVIAGVHKSHSFDEAIAITLMLASGASDDLAPIQQQVMSKLFPYQNASERIVEDLFAGLSDES
jgi:hypothetical protein